MKKLLYLSFLVLGVFAFGQERTVFGNVTFAEDGTPAVGTTVMIKNTIKGAFIDFDGNYSIKATPNDTLVFSCLAHKRQEIIADKEEINVIMEEEEYVKRMNSTPPPFNHSQQPPPLKEREFSFYDLKNPKSNFKKNAKNNAYFILISDDARVRSYSIVNFEFGQKYNYKYAWTPPDLSLKYIKKHNKLTFKYLNKKYKKDWQNEIRKDAIGLDEFLKKK